MKKRNKLLKFIKKKSAKDVVSIRLSPETESWARSAAKRLNVSLTSLIESALVLLKSKE